MSTLHSVFGHVWKLAWRFNSWHSFYIRFCYHGISPGPARDSSRGGGGGINPDIGASTGGLLRQMRLLAVEVFLPRRAFRHLLL